MACCEPSPKATTETTEAIPIIIPSIVKKVRNLWVDIATSAILSASTYLSHEATRARELSFAATAPLGFCDAVFCNVEL